MIVKVNYNKSTGDVTVSSDISSINVEVGENTISDTDANLDFEISVDTSEYEQINELPTE
jgi:hypothetical protein